MTSTFLYHMFTIWPIHDNKNIAQLTIASYRADRFVLPNRFTVYYVFLFQCVQNMLFLYHLFIHIEMKRKENKILNMFFFLFFNASILKHFSFGSFFYFWQKNRKRINNICPLHSVQRRIRIEDS